MAALWDREFKDGWRQYKGSSELRTLLNEAKEEWPRLVAELERTLADPLA
jgi:hypothetical protein